MRSVNIHCPYDKIMYNSSMVDKSMPVVNYVILILFPLGSPACKRTCCKPHGGESSCWV